MRLKTYTYRGKIYFAANKEDLANRLVPARRNINGNKNVPNLAKVLAEIRRLPASK